ncbi:MAG: flagellar protein FlgN [Gammaproteobacteria bacterium]
MRSLQAILELEVAALSVVLQTLHDEYSALDKRAPEALLAASNAKADAVAHAAQLERERRELGQSGHDRQPVVADKLFTELKQLAADCRMLNDRNGQLIRGQRRRIEGSLNVLRGRAGTPDTYGRDGATAFLRDAKTPLASY